MATLFLKPFLSKNGIIIINFFGLKMSCFPTKTCLRYYSVLYLYTKQGVSSFCLCNENSGGIRRVLLVSVQYGNSSCFGLFHTNTYKMESSKTCSSQRTRYFESKKIWECALCILDVTPNVKLWHASFCMILLTGISLPSGGLNVPIGYSPNVVDKLLCSTPFNANIV